MDEIKINNSEESAVDSKWKNPGASLYNELCDASNWKELLEETYLIAPINDIHNDSKMKTSFSRSGCKYPHHIVKDGKLILSKSGVKAAYARLKQMGKYNGDARNHIEKHLKELDMMDKNGVHYEDTIHQNFFQIEMYLQEKTGFPFIEDFIQDDYLEEKYSPLKFDYRKVYDINTGHMLKLVYSLDNIHIVFPGKSYGDDDHGYDPNTPKHKADIKDAEANIRKNGNGDHSSWGQKLLAIHDIVTRKYLQKAEVIGPYNTGIESSLVKLSKEGLKWVQNKYKGTYKVATVKVGEIEDNKHPTFKTTHWFNKEALPIETDDGIFTKDKIADNTTGRMNVAEAIRNIRSPAKINDISGEYVPGKSSNAVKYNHPSKKDIKRNPELYKESYDYLEEKSHGKSNFEFRFVIGEDNGHLYKIVYKLNPENITKDNFSGGEARDKLVKEIRKTGNSNYQSKGNKVIGIIDMCNNKRINKISAYPVIHNSGGSIMPVKFTKYIKTMSRFYDDQQLEKLKKELQKECPTGICPNPGFEDAIEKSKANGQNPIIYIVGEIDDTETYKTTNIDDVLKGMLGLESTQLFENEIIKNDPLKYGRGYHNESIQESMEWIDQFVNNSEFRESVSKPYQECRTPEELMNWMSNHIAYGWRSLNGKIYYDINEDNEEEFFTNYRLQSPSELSQSGVGVCWDQCELEREWFTNNNIPNTVFYIALKISDNNVPSHTFLVFKDNDKYYWFEHSWGAMKGIYQFNTLQELHDEVTKQHRKAYNDDESPVFIINIKNTPDYGITCQEFMSWADKQDEFEYSEDNIFTENAATLANIQSPQSLSKWMSTIKPAYAAKYDNFYHNIDDNDFNPNDQSSLQPPKDIARSKKGSVYDKVELERYWFDNHGYEYAVLCLIMEKDINDFIIHPFIVYQQGKSIYWFENSLPNIDGSIQFKRLNDLIKCVIKYVHKANDTSTNRIAVYYLSDPPKYGINKREYIRYVQTQIELPINDLPTKLFNESVEYFEEKSHDEYINGLREEAHMLSEFKENVYDSYDEQFIFEAEDNVKEETQEESMPKQTDKNESDKNGVNRKKLYIAFIEWSKTFSDKNAFGSMFDKDAFHVTYPFVPEAMRYFYRIANPLMCILSGNLTFFQLSELRKVNTKNSQLSNMMIFAATENDMRVFNVKDGAVYMATEENGAIKLGTKLADTFDLYIQTMINRGDILNGADPAKVPDAPPDLSSDEKNTSEDNTSEDNTTEEDIMDEPPIDDTQEDNPESIEEPQSLEDSEESK